MNSNAVIIRRILMEIIAIELAFISLVSSATGVAVAIVYFENERR